jgi:hypothetical protein
VLRSLDLVAVTRLALGEPPIARCAATPYLGLERPVIALRPRLHRVDDRIFEIAMVSVASSGFPSCRALLPACAGSSSERSGKRKTSKPVLVPTGRLQMPKVSQFT